MSTEERKALVHRLVAEVFNEGRLEVLDELYEPAAASRARAWIAPFRVSFSDLELKIVQLVAEGDAVVAQFVCSAILVFGSGTLRRTDDSIGWRRSTSSASPVTGSAARGARGHPSPSPSART